MDGGKLDAIPAAQHWMDILDENTWFEELCEELEVSDPTTIWSQIETWMGANDDTGDILPSDVLLDYKNTAALKSFLKRAITAAVQATATDNSLYHKLETSTLYKTIYGIDPKAAKSLLIFACARSTGGQAARLETEVGRWSAFQFKQPPDAYFYRQGNALFGTEQKRDNAILTRQTGKKPQVSQYQTIQNNSLRCLGKYLITRRNFDAVDANTQFQKCLSIQNAPEGHLWLLTFANLAGQLQTYCPDVYKAAQTIIEQAVDCDDSAEMQLYFLGSIMRRARQSIGIAEKVDSLTIETNQDFQCRVQSMLAADNQSWENALKSMAEDIGIKSKSLGLLI